MKKNAILPAALTGLALCLTPDAGSLCAFDACTTAVVGAQASADGKPIFWKNRDTESLWNKVVYVHEVPYPYLALVDAEDSTGRRAYAGLNAALFEVHNHGCKRFDATDVSENYLINTNFSRSGKMDERTGYLRFDRATELFQSVTKPSHVFILQRAARDPGHALLQHPTPDTWKKFEGDQPFWIHTNHSINRSSTASAIVVHGVRNGDDPRQATLWVVLGEPVCSVAIPLWVEAGSPPSALSAGRKPSICREALRMKKILRPLQGSDRSEYADVTRLDNKGGTGWLPLLLKTEKDLLVETETFLKTKPDADAKKSFEGAAAARILSALQQIH